MIISQDKELIARYIKKYAEQSSTEAMLSFVADNNGMLAVSRLIVRKNTADDREVMGWIDEQCYKSKIDVRNFLGMVNQIFSLLQPAQKNGKYYAVLDLEFGASKEEIKEAFRKLSHRYHPDTASADEADATRKFLEINNAYKTLLGGRTEDSELSGQPQATSDLWQAGKNNSQRAVVKKKNIILFGALTLMLIVISIFAARGYQKKAMISGLRQHHAAFVPPVLNTEKEEGNVGEVQEVQPTEINSALEQLEPEIQIASEPELEAAPEIVIAPPVVKIKLPELSVQKKEKVEEKIQISEKLTGSESPQTIPVPNMRPAKNVRKKAPRNEVTPHAVVVADQVKKETAIPSAEEIQAVTQERIEEFLMAYTNSYEHMDLFSFSRFFDLNATENGKPFGELLPTYTELFQKAENISLVVSTLKWEQKQKQIFLDGRFNIRISYKNSGIVQGTGEINFLLADNNKQLSIKELTYHFDKK